MEMTELRQELTQSIEAHYEKRELSQIKLILSELNPADIAEILEEFPDNQRLLFFRVLT